MKKFVTLFTDSYKELKSVRTITTAAMLAAIAIILGMFSINVGSTIRIGFSGIPNGVCAYLFGHVVGGLFLGVLDVVQSLLTFAGPFCSGITAVVILAGVLYGCFYYKKPITFWRVLLAKFVVMLICNVILNTLCLSVLYGKGFMVILPARVIKNLIMWPIDSMIFYSVLKALNLLGILKAVRTNFA